MASSAATLSVIPPKLVWSYAVVDAMFPLSASSNATTKVGSGKSTTNNFDSLKCDKGNGKLKTTIAGRLLTPEEAAKWAQKDADDH